MITSWPKFEWSALHSFLAMMVTLWWWFPGDDAFLTTQELFVFWAEEKCDPFWCLFFWRFLVPINISVTPHKVSSQISPSRSPLFSKSPLFFNLSSSQFLILSKCHLTRSSILYGIDRSLIKRDICILVSLGYFFLLLLMKPNILNYRKSRWAAWAGISSSGLV